jgi:hypothetical protein
MLFQFYLFYDNFAVYPAITNTAHKLKYMKVGILARIYDCMYTSSLQELWSEEHKSNPGIPEDTSNNGW